MSPPPIRGFIANSLLDWEGRICAVLFLGGCNFRCAYCHSPHLVGAAGSPEAIPIQNVMASLLRNREWVDGVVISGGEPTLAVGLRELLELFRDAGMPVKLDTNGSRPAVLEEVLAGGLAEHVAMDVKAPFDGRYAGVVGKEVDLDAVRASASLLMRSGTSYEFRTTVCPAQLGGGDVEDLAQDIEGAQMLFLQKFRPVNCLDPAMEGVKPYNDDEMRALAERAARHVKRCMVRGDSGSDTAASESGKRSGAGE